MTPCRTLRIKKENEVVQLSMPCLHEIGKETDHARKVPDYHPLTDLEIQELLDMAAGCTDDAYILSRILKRLTQGVPGVTCPRELFGPVGDRVMRVRKLFIKNHYLGGTDELVKKFVLLLDENKPL